MSVWALHSLWIKSLSSVWLWGNIFDRFPEKAPLADYESGFGLNVDLLNIYVFWFNADQTTLLRISEVCVFDWKVSGQIVCGGVSGRVSRHWSPLCPSLAWCDTWKGGPRPIKCWYVGKCSGSQECLFTAQCFLNVFSKASLKSFSCRIKITSRD